MSDATMIQETLPQTMASIPQPSFSKAVGAIATLLDQLMETLGVQGGQLNYLNSVAQDGIKEQSTYADDMPHSSYPGYFFGGTTDSYAELQQNAMVQQNQTTALSNKESSISAQISNEASELIGESQLGKEIIMTFVYTS